MATGDFVLYTDGGSSSGTVAAAACLITHPQGDVVHGLVSLLGEATNNEAEIFASLLGFAWMGSHLPDCSRVRWVSDSEYLLKSATAYIHNWQRNGWKTADKKPVKNQGLWRTFLALTGDLTLAAEHVRGHTGHPENETCDEALNWAKIHGADALFADDCVEVEIPDLPVHAPWLLLDGRGVLTGIRREHPEPEAIEALRSLTAKGTPGDGVAPAEPRPRTSRAVDLSPLAEQVGKALQTAESFGKSHPAALSAARQLREILAKLERV